jgi:hypothetical protein
MPTKSSLERYNTTATRVDFAKINNSTNKLTLAEQLSKSIEK